VRFLKLASERHHKTLHGFDASAIDLLSHADWLGNVRELQNEIERLVALAADGQTITADHLSPELERLLLVLPGLELRGPGRAIATAAF
jgi:two-component system response regulator HupR/HoxA